MKRLMSLSIRMMILLITCIVALPAMGIIVYSGAHYRKEMLDDASKDTQKLVDRIANEQVNLVIGAEQLLVALAQLPDVKRHDAAKVEPILRELRKLNPIYSNIFIADKNGLVWATAVPVKPPFMVTDRRYFRNALSSGRLSSGEYVVSRATSRPALNLAYPLKNERGEVVGVICIGFVIDKYRQLLKSMQLPVGTSFVLIDHKGVILFRGIDPERYIGTPYMPEAFRQLQDGPEAATNVRKGLTGDTRIISYRKLKLAGEDSPYMYVTAGIPVSVATREANRELVNNLAIYALFLLLACGAAALLGKRYVVDRLKLLEHAAHRLAEGDLHVRVSDLVAGGEMGRLAESFDRMTGELLRREEERKAAEVEKNILTDQLIQAQKMESIGQLAGGVAHDFNNLLMPIIGYSEHLKDELPDNPPAAAMAGQVLKAAEKARDLVRQLLSFSRKQILEMKTVDFNRIIEEFHDILRRTIRESIEIRLRLSDERCCIRCDRNQIEQILINLAVNAQDAISEGGIITIETATVLLDDEYVRHHADVAPGRYLMLSVTDSGCGMDPVTRQRIFEPFFSTKGVGKGTGLGLATVYGIVRQHEGNIWVYSEPDKGTTFKVYFPIIDALAADVMPTPDQRVSLVGGQRSILVVEDNDMVRNMVSEMLTRLGFDVLSASGAHEALGMIEGRELVLLVTDVVMPELTGPDLYGRLEKRFPGLPVLYMSGYTNNVIVHHGVLDEGINFIQKPFAINEFADKVEALLG